MTIIAWTAQHRILPINLLWEEYAITIEWQEGILTLIELLEVEGVSNSNCWSVIAVTPCNPITILNPCNTWIVLIFRVDHLRVSCLKRNRLVIDFPVDTVFTKTSEDVHLYRLVIATEHSSEAILKWNDSTVEDTV